jgi:diadenosine tetraphosphate (Ap4A) HIT family hydrolase
VTLESLWAGWRMQYVASAGEPGSGGDNCVFCRILACGEPDRDTLVLWRGERTVAILNAYPYTSGHLMILPVRHLSEIEDLEADEAGELWAAAADGVRALKAAYRPEGINLGANLGRAAGAGLPSHFHLHLVPRWEGDTNFMTAVAGTRVLPEALPASWERLRGAWPTLGADE